MAGLSANVTHNVRGFSPAVRDFETSVKKAAAELAAADRVSLNQFIAAAVAEKVGSLRAADDFLRERAGTAKPKDMLKYLRRAPKVAPNADDKP